MTKTVANPMSFRLVHRRVCGPVLAFVAFVLLTACTVAATSNWKVAVFPSGAEFALEIAADDATRVRGYMFREKIGPREGMLFVFDETEFFPIWMKNCKVSLDIIWLDDNYRVVEIKHDFQPCPEKGPCPSAFPMRKARYVLEVAGGVAHKESLKFGDQIVLLTEPRHD